MSYIKMADKNDNILTDEAIKKEMNQLRRMFKAIKDEDPDKYKLVEKIIEEAAFQKSALKAAKANMIENGIQTVTKNASQKFVKENPAVQTYDKYVRSYTANIKALIEMLPPKEKKNSKLAMLRGEI